MGNQRQPAGLRDNDSTGATRASPRLTADALVACHDCDLLLPVPTLRPAQRARCPRCGALLGQNKRNSVQRTLTLALTGVVLFVLANAYPFMTFRFEGREQENTLITGVIELFHYDMRAVAVLVFFISILAPLIKLLATIYVFLPLKLGWVPPRAAPVMRLIEIISPWAMMEVYMLGVLVAIVKLSDMATIIPGIALYAFSALIVVEAAASASLDPGALWRRIGTPRRRSMVR